jgi:PAS domain S-box-containing protein
MTALRRPWLALIPVGLAAGIVALTLVLTSNHETDAAATGGLGLLLGWSFIGGGLFGWARRPDNRTGALMVAFGFSWFLTALADADSSVLFTIGNLVAALPLAVFIHLLLAFPDGHVEGRWPRLIVAAAYPTALLAHLTGLTVDSTPQDDCTSCPSNAFLVGSNETAANALVVFWNLVGLAFMVAVAVILARRWRAATAPARRVLTPVYVGGVAAVLLLGVSFALDPVTDAAQIIGFVGFLSFLSVPFFFLAGVLRTRLSRSSALRLLQDTPERPTIDEAQAGLRRALNDPTLRLLVKDEDRGGYVDADGRLVEVPEESAREAVTWLASEGLPIAAVVYDPALRKQPELLEDVFTAARLALVKDRSAQALRASERRNRALLDAIPDNMFRIRGDGTFVDFHTNRPEALALPPDQIIGSNIRDHLPAEEASERLESIRRVIATGDSETVESQLVDRRGRLRDREIRMVKSGENEVLSINRDITDRKRAEEEVLLQRDFMTTVVNTAQSVFCVLTVDGEILRFNDFCEQLTGLDDDASVRGRPFWDAFAMPESADAVRAAFLVDEPGREYEHTWVSASGPPRLVAWSITPLVDETGEERRLLHGLDVTQRRRNEEELRQQYEFLVAVGRATPSLLAVVDEEGRVSRHGVSAAFTRALGYGDREAIGRLLWDLVSPTDEEILRGALAEAKLGGVAEGNSTWYPRGREPLSVAWSIRPVGLLEEQQSFLVCGIDVTEQQRHQEELKRSRVRIVEAEAAERQRLERNLHDGAQQRLVSLSLALRLAQARLDSNPGRAAELLAGASVELTTALEELRELARGIHPAILTDRGLPFALESLAERAPFPVELVATPAGRLPEPVEAAAFYVVSEALANAAKYARASFARISVTCDRGHALVEVSDDGIGGADPSHGTGLRGLVDRVDALDGTLVVDSPPGHGTSVRASIPLPEAAPQEPALRLGVSPHRLELG